MSMNEKQIEAIMTHTSNIMEEVDQRLFKGVTISEYIDQLYEEEGSAEIMSFMHAFLDIKEKSAEVFCLEIDGHYEAAFELRKKIAELY